MVNLEETIKSVEPKREKTRSTEILSPIHIERPIPVYEGFKLIEDKAYSGGTSIKYWM